MRQSLLNVLLIPAVLLMAALAQNTPARALTALRYPFQLDNVEGYLLDEAIQFSKGRGIYQPIEKAPYLVNNYPPVYSLFFAGLLKAGETPSLAYGRMIGVSALLGLCLGMMMIPFGAGRQVMPALLCPLLFLATFSAYRWSAYARVDMLALFFTMLGLNCFLSERTRFALGLSVFFFSLAALTKQTAIVAPAACLLFLAARNWRQAIGFAAAMVVVVGGATGALVAMTGGEYWRHTVVYNANTMNWDSLEAWKTHVLLFYKFWYAGCGIGLMYLLYRLFVKFKPDEEARKALVESPSNPSATEPTQPDLFPESLSHSDNAASATAGTKQIVREDKRRSQGERLAILWIYFALASLSSLSIAKAGSAENYLLEPLAAAAVLFCAAMSRAFWESASARGAWVSRAAAVAFIALLGMHVFAFRYEKEPNSGKPLAEAMMRPWQMSEEELERGRKLYVAVSATNGEVLCEDPIFGLLEGRRPPINPFIMSELAAEGKWDQAAFVAAIEDGHFGAIVLTTRLEDMKTRARFTPEMIEAMKRHYRLEDIYPLGLDGQTYYLYKPVRSRLDQRTIAMR